MQINKQNRRADLCVQVGLPEAAGSNGKAEDKEKPKVADEEPSAQQLLQLKKQHRLQLQERNRQICHLQEDREKLRRSLRKAESDLRFEPAKPACHCLFVLL